MWSFLQRLRFRPSVHLMALHPGLSVMPRRSWAARSRLEIIVVVNGGGLVGMKTADY
jgi:hypothetical protein